MKEIMYFSAQWCGPCKSYKPKFQQIAESKADQATFTIIDVDENQELMKKFNVRGVPTVVVVDDGVEVTRGVGAAQIDQVLSDHL